jgi:predicted nucleic acid-binding protein
VIIHLDTTVLIDALTAPWRSFDLLERSIDDRHTIAISAPTYFEWLRGSRTAEERASMREWFLEEQVAAFDAYAAITAAAIYRQLSRKRHRDIDIAIAACAIEHNAAFWTLNPEDFADIPGLRLYQP